MDNLGRFIPCPGFLSPKNDVMVIIFASLIESPGEGWNEVSYAGKVENRACCGHDTPGWGAGEVQGNTFGYQLGSCLFRRSCFCIISLRLPSFQTQR